MGTLAEGAVLVVRTSQTTMSKTKQEKELGFLQNKFKVPQADGECGPGPEVRTPDTSAGSLCAHLSVWISLFPLPATFFRTSILPDATRDQRRSSALDVLPTHEPAEAHHQPRSADAREPTRRSDRVLDKHPLIFCLHFAISVLTWPKRPATARSPFAPFPPAPVRTFASATPTSGHTSARN